VGTGSGGTAGAAVAYVAATTADTSCSDPTASAAPRGGLLAAAALSAALDTLDEHRLVGTDVPDLSTLAGARSGTIGAALSTRRLEFELQPFETRASGEADAYLKVEKPRFLFLEGSTDVVAAAGVATAALADASVARTGASVTRAAPFVDHLVAGAPATAPGVCSSAASAALGEGVQAPTTQGGLPPPPSLSSSSPSPSDEYSEVAGGESPCCSRSRNSSSLCSRRSRRRILRSFLRRSLLLPPLRRTRARARGVGGSDRAAFTTTLCWEE
jgi:hypothetical protein